MSMRLPSMTVVRMWSPSSHSSRRAPSVDVFISGAVSRSLAATELALEHLPGRVARERVDEADLARKLEAREATATVLDELVRCRRRVRTHHDECDGDFTPPRI